MTEKVAVQIESWLAFSPLLLPNIVASDGTN